MAPADRPAALADALIAAAVQAERARVDLAEFKPGRPETRLEAAWPAQEAAVRALQVARRHVVEALEAALTTSRLVIACKCGEPADARGMGPYTGGADMCPKCRAAYINDSLAAHVPPVQRRALDRIASEQADAAAKWRGLLKAVLDNMPGSLHEARAALDADGVAW